MPAGVDDAAKVKASYLAAVAHGTEVCSLIGREKAIGIDVGKRETDANELLAAAGKTNYTEVDVSLFMRGNEFTHLSDLYFPDNLSNVTKH